MKHLSEAPYQGIAYIYDYIMHHVDYENWADYVKQLGKHFDHEFNDVLEMACGTGSFTFYFAEDSFSILGIDNSPTMIENASKTNTSSNVRFEVGDMRDFKSDQKFDTVLCLYDSVNYLISKDDLQAAFNNISACLKPGGLFIFDITTAKNSQKYFNGEEEFEETPDFCYWRKSTYNGRMKKQYTRFVIFIKEGELYRRYHEKHEQRIYTVKTIQEALRKSGLQFLEMFHEFTLNPPSLDSLRIHMAAQKPNP